MSSWEAVEAAEPELAARARACLTATTNAVLATLKRDGSPRLSGIDPLLFGGELYLGSMADARKGGDLRRDPRLALHSIPWESRRTADGEPSPAADVKLAGRAVLVTDPAEVSRVMGHHEEATGHEAPDASDLFRIDVQELVLISVEDDELVVDHWSADSGRTITRRS
jgi:Pyridoxamine 5'-phosphate oxidase